jgi:hypothetical protein
VYITHLHLRILPTCQSIAPAWMCRKVSMPRSILHVLKRRYQKLMTRITWEFPKAHQVLINDVSHIGWNSRTIPNATLICAGTILLWTNLQVQWQSRKYILRNITIHSEFHTQESNSKHLFLATTYWQQTVTLLMVDTLRGVWEMRRHFLGINRFLSVPSLKRAWCG